MKKLKLSKAGLQELAFYANQCSCMDLEYNSKTLLELVRFHLKAIVEKLHKKGYDLFFKDKEFVLITFTHAEVISLSFVFKQVPVEPLVQGIMYNLLGGL